MSFKSKLVAIGTGDTDVFEMGATLQGAVVLGIGNANGASRTITLKFYNALLNETTTLVSGYTIAANTMVKWPMPILMATGDKIILSASHTSSITAHASITDSAAAPVAQGFTPRGEWSNAITYVANDLVRVEDAISAGRGATYVAKPNVSANLNKDPTSETAFWMVYVADGPDGDLSAADIGVSVQGYDADTAKLDVKQTWSRPQKSDPFALTHNTAWDGDLYQALTVAVNGSNFTIANPSPVPSAGTYVTITITWASAHSLAFGNKFKGITGITWPSTSGKEAHVAFRSDGTDLKKVGYDLDIGN